MSKKYTITKQLVKSSKETSYEVLAKTNSLLYGRILLYGFFERDAEKYRKNKFCRIEHGFVEQDFKGSDELEFIQVYEENPVERYLQMRAIYTLER